MEMIIGCANDENFYDYKISIFRDINKSPYVKTRICILFILSLAFGFTQENIVNAQDNNSTEVDKLIDEAWSYRYKDWDRSLELFEQALVQAKSKDDLLLQLKVLESRSQITPDALPLDQALIKNNEAIDFYKEHDFDEPLMYARILFNSALIHKRTGQHDQALKYLNTVQDIYSSEKPSLNWIVYGQMADIFNVLGRYDEAIKYYDQTLELVEKSGSRMDYGYQLVQNITFCKDIEDYNCYSNLLAKYIDYKGGDLNWYESDYHFQLVGELGTNSPDHLEELKKQLNAHVAQKNLILASEASYQVSSIYKNQKNYKLALYYGKKAVDIYKAKNSPSQLSIYYKNIAEIEALNHNYKNAYEHFKNYKIYSDTLTKLEVQSNLNEVQTKYETEKKEQEIVLLSAQNDLKDQRIRSARTTSFLSLIGILFISGFAIFIYRGRLKIRGLNRSLESREKALSKSLTEKEFLLREIHHRVKNNLQVISSLLKLQSEKIADKKARLALDEGRNRVRSMSIIHQNLYKENNLSGISMKEYIQQLTSELLDSYKIEEGRINVILDVQDISLDVDTAVPIGLIINELVSNSFKHAFPDNRNGEIRIKLNEENEFLHLSVIDDGVGYNKNEIRPDSFGHDLVIAFAERLKADYKIAGTNGAAATFLIQDFKLAA